MALARRRSPSATLVLAASLVLLVSLATGQASAPAASAAAKAPASASRQFATLRIPARVPLPRLRELSGTVGLDMTPVVLEGPGDNSTSEDPMVRLTGRVYNSSLVAGVIRVRQGTTLRLRVCNSLDAQLPTQGDESAEINYSLLQYPAPGEGLNGFRDPNILANHLHGFYGNPGTHAPPCDPAPPAGERCYRGDNVFADIAPGQCTQYQYDFSAVHAPGVLWIHPHHHGSSSLQSTFASVPVVVDRNKEQGWDYLAPASCAALRAVVEDPANEVIMHMQASLTAVGLDGGGPGGDPGGPTDDGYIAVALKSAPQDPYCCDEPAPGGANDTWSDEGTGAELAASVSMQAFESSGVNGEFTLINGVYQPTVSMQAGKLYLWRMVEASTMKWVDLTFDQPGCSLGLVARDGVPLRGAPRLADHIVMGAANRVDVLVACEPGNYTLRTGAGPLDNLADCESTHCELLRQDVLATLVAEEAAAGASAAAPAELLAALGTCQPRFPPYLADLRNMSASGNATVISVQGLMNFTNPTAGGPNSGGCAINGLTYGEVNPPMQEELGRLTELELLNVDVHPFHHHTQPFQIVRLTNDSAELNGSWRVGDYVDTLMVPHLGTHALVRWVPGPVEVTGTGFAVLHCHILPHEDEGCMMRTQLLDYQYVPDKGGLSNGAIAGITLAALAVTAASIGAVVVAVKRRRWRRENADTRAALMVAGEPAVSAV